MNGLSFEGIRATVRTREPAAVYYAWVRANSDGSLTLEIHSDPDWQLGQDVTIELDSPVVKVNVDAVFEGREGDLFSFRVPELVAIALAGHGARRRSVFHKVSIDGPVHISHADVFDISFTGFAFKSAFIFASGVNIVAEYLCENEPLRQQARVVYCIPVPGEPGSYRVGCEITRMNAIDTARWRNAITSASNQGLNSSNKAA